MLALLHFFVRELQIPQFIESRYLFSFAIYRQLNCPLLNNSRAFAEDWGEMPVESFKKNAIESRCLV